MPTIADPAGNQGLEAGTHMSMYTLYISILYYSIFCIYMQLQLCMFGIHKTDTTTPTDVQHVQAAGTDPTHSNTVVMS